MAAKNFKQTRVHKLAYEQAMDIFERTRSFPKEETYSLTDQVRRSSRSVCTSVAEAYRKKLYPAYFVSKVSDGDSENSETNVWIDFSLSCKYISEEEHTKWINRNEQIGRLLCHMINNPERY
jgi:four helix bundle protein